MVQLVPTPALLSAIQAFHDLNLHLSDKQTDDATSTIPPPPLPPSSETDKASPITHIDHKTITKLSQALVAHHKSQNNPTLAAQYRLHRLLRGCSVYIPPKPPKPEPSEEYKALMAKLRREQEEKEYIALLHPATEDTYSMGKFIDKGGEEEEYTFRDLKSDLSIIVNVLLSIGGTAGAIWVAASSWPVPERLGMALFGCILVAVAEVVVLMGYYKRIEEAKGVEKRRSEKKEVVRTWEVSRDGVVEKKGE